MWRIVVVPIGGAVPAPAGSVTCDSVSVVTLIASSTSRRDERQPQLPRGRSPGSSRST